MTNITPDNSQQNADNVSAWSLIKPYWISEERGIAWGLLVAIIAINMTVVWINVRLNRWNADFYNALQSKNVHDFPQLLLVFTVLAFAYILLAVYGRYLRQMLGFRWRQWLTDKYLEQWLGDRAFYRIERDRLADNPDQRISDDLQSFATTTLSLSLDLLSTLVTLVTFITILWTIAGALTLTAFGTPLVIPGYMVWAAALYAIAGSLIIQKVGHPLVSINYQQQKVEADFRFGLIRVRENAEQIAFYDGIGTETANAKTIFARIRDNWWMIMKYTKRMTFVLSFYGQIAIIFPIMVAAPRYFAGAFSFGVLMQISSAFGTVSDSFSWFINSYSTLVEWRATVNRLREFKRVMRSTHIREAISPATAHGGINLHYTNTNALTTSGLSLALPNGTPLARVADVVDRARVALARAWAVGIGQEHADARARRALAVRRRHDRRTRRREDDVHPAAELPADRHAESGAGVSVAGRHVQRRGIARGAARVQPGGLWGSAGAIGALGEDAVAGRAAAAGRRACPAAQARLRVPR